MTLARVVVVLAEDDWEGVEACELGSGDHPTCRSEDDIYFGDACGACYRLEVVCLARLNKLQLHSA